MNNWLLAVLIGVACGVLLGIKIARDSQAKHPIQGGLLAWLFHYLACAGFTSMVPFIIAGIVMGLPFVKLFGTAVGFLVITAVFLLIHAVFERPFETPSASLSG